MTLYGKSNRLLIEDSLATGTFVDCQMTGCDLENLVVADVEWRHADVRDSHVNDALFRNSKLYESTFFRSNFIKARFQDILFSTMVLDGLTLIKADFSNVKFLSTRITNACLQRFSLLNSHIVLSSFYDFEAINSHIENCVFYNSTVGISYGAGANGFSDSIFKNCIFYNCRFEGFPLRGAHLDSCVFHYCSGEIGDSMDCTNVAGIGTSGKPQYVVATSVQKADLLLRSLS